MENQKPLFKNTVIRKFKFNVTMITWSFGTTTECMKKGVIK